MSAIRSAIAIILVTAIPAAAGQYYPRYAGPDGGIVEFHKAGFSWTFFDDNGDYSFRCQKLSSMTKSIHWGQCVGGKKFLFTLDPEHPETMKIGDVVYKECGKLWDKC